ncbi:hypothetical protein B0H19DRAFT_1079341 [Mycena capillaripes]|nr:hypothetical protein B0H19DRAFT_1079341 [Mycena capillaripes]
MSKSSEPSTPRRSKERRRAYVACLACRKRKVKCVTPSDDDDTPCTRCKSRGQQCEFRAVPDGEDEGSFGSTPPDTSPIMLFPAWSATSPAAQRPEISPLDSFLPATRNSPSPVGIASSASLVYNPDPGANPYLLSPLLNPSPMVSLPPQFTVFDDLHPVGYPGAYPPTTSIFDQNPVHITTSPLYPHTSAVGGQFCPRDFNSAYAPCPEVYAQPPLLCCICELGPLPARTLFIDSFLSMYHTTYYTLNNGQLFATQELQFPGGDACA